MTRVKWVIALAVALFVAGMASAAYPPPGRSYELLDHGVRTTIRLAPDGSHLAAYFLQWRVPCVKGAPLHTGLVNIGERRVDVAGDGTFAYETKVEFFGVRFHKGLERASFQAGFRGQFAADGQSVSGTAHVQVHSRHRDCSAADIPITAYLHGTPQAPDRTDILATGVYTMSGHALTAGTMDVDAAIRQVDKLSFSFFAHCRRGGTLSGRKTAVDVPVSANGDVKVGFSEVVPSKHHAFSLERFALHGRFTGSGGYGFTGGVAIHAAVIRHGRVIDRCTFSDPAISAGLS